MKPKYWAILILASAAIITSLVYYLRQPAPYSGPVVVPYVNKVQSQATTTPQTADDLQGWQTYTNSQNGFSLLYPPSWHLESSNTDTIDIYPPDFNNGKWVQKMEILIGKKDQNDPINFIESNNDKYLGQLNFGNSLWYEGQYEGDSSAAGTVYYLLDQSNIKLTATIYLSGDDNKIYPQILSTFQFTTPTSPANSSPTAQAQTNSSGLQTYTNSQYGFSFDYANNLNQVPNQPNFLVDLKDNNANYVAISVNQILNGNGIAANTSSTSLSISCTYNPILMSWIPASNGTLPKDCPQEIDANPNVKIYILQQSDARVDADIPTPDQKNMLFFSAQTNWRQLLSSLRFTAPDSQAWKLYNVESYGVQFSYPPDFTIENYYGGDSERFIVKNNDKIKVALKNDDLSSYNNFQDYAVKTAEDNCSHQSANVSIYCSSLSQPVTTENHNGLKVYKIYLNRVSVSLPSDQSSMVIGPIFAFDLRPLNNSNLSAVFLNLDGFTTDESLLDKILATFKFTN